MCGIVGVVATSSAGLLHNDVATFEQGLMISLLRGQDATGMFGIGDADHSPSVHKTLGLPMYLFGNKQYQAYMSYMFRKGWGLVGHCRAATTGQANKLEHAHPFQFKRPDGSLLTLVHNGTLFPKQSLPDFHKFSVDSEWIANLLAFSTKPTAELLHEIDGAMALVWHDTRDNKLRFFRNDKRPLSYAWTAHNSLVFASEESSLIWLDNKIDLKFKSDAIKEFEAFQIYEHELRATEFQLVNVEKPKVSVYVYPTSAPFKSEFGVYTDRPVELANNSSLLQRTDKVPSKKDILSRWNFSSIVELFRTSSLQSIDWLTPQRVVCAFETETKEFRVPFLAKDLVRIFYHSDAVSSRVIAQYRDEKDELQYWSFWFTNQPPASTKSTPSVFYPKTIDNVVINEQEVYTVGDILQLEVYETVVVYKQENLTNYKYYCTRLDKPDSGMADIVFYGSLDKWPMAKFTAVVKYIKEAPAKSSSMYEIYVAQHTVLE